MERRRWNILFSTRWFSYTQSLTFREPLLYIRGGKPQKHPLFPFSSFSSPPHSQLHAPCPPPPPLTACRGENFGAPAPSPACAIWTRICQPNTISNYKAPNCVLLLRIPVIFRFLIIDFRTFSWEPGRVGVTMRNNNTDGPPSKCGEGGRSRGRGGDENEAVGGQSQTRTRTSRRRRGTDRSSKSFPPLPP